MLSCVEIDGHQLERSTNGPQLSLNVVHLEFGELHGFCDGITVGSDEVCTWGDHKTNRRLWL